MTLKFYVIVLWTMHVYYKYKHLHSTQRCCFCPAFLSIFFSVDLSLFAYEKNCPINFISCRVIRICLDQLRDFSNIKSGVLIAVQLVLIYRMVGSIIAVYFSVLWFVHTLVTHSQMPSWTVLVQMFESKGNFPFMPTKAQPAL